MSKPGDSLTSDDALNAVEEAIELLSMARNKGATTTEGNKLVRAAYTLLSLAHPVLEKLRA